MAADARLSAVALTDHDTVQGLDEFLRAAQKNTLRAITGVEISTTLHEYSFHLLGYGISHRDPCLGQWLELLQTGRKKRNEQIIARLQQLGMQINIDELESLSGCGQTGRPHIARLLLQKGLVASVDDAFRLYLRKGASAWVSRFSYPVSESIAMIHQAGGLAVLAHPGQITPQPSSLRNLVGELSTLGLDGMEAYYPGYSPKVRKTLKTIALRHKLVITGGSDYHGDNKLYSRMAGRKYGFCPPDNLLDQFNGRFDPFPAREKEQKNLGAD